MKKIERPLERVEGNVVVETVLRGTASEHVGAVLRTPAGERLHLQRIGGNPFGDEETDSLHGRNVEIEGYRLDGVFRYRNVLKTL
jgi:hypothetical protein